ncbi:MAG: 3-deoxy-manno-octulosonate cytidylyltransferase [Bacteroidales bacterium]|nr:3-deoxy-manno-octulosonate cytidylyltransferase [Bacteroidales bacterium]
MKVLGIIPARYNSSRFSGKPLASIQGKSMIQRVYEQAKKCQNLNDVVVATDDERIFNHVNNFGGKVLMTSSVHTSGTERCNEAYQIIESKKQHFDIILNIQGDEPFISPTQIDKVIACFTHADIQIATLAKTITDFEELKNPNVVKLVKDNLNRALYFSRFPIPYMRDGLCESSLKNHFFLKHIGLYAFRANILDNLCKLPPSSLEIAEVLEQLRWLENGYCIFVNITEIESISIDTPDDLDKLLKMNLSDLE